MGDYYHLSGSREKLVRVSHFEKVIKLFVFSAGQWVPQEVVEVQRINQFLAVKCQDGLFYLLFRDGHCEITDLLVY
jgi:hypothetical protein